MTKTIVKKQNQLHPPLPKKKRVDKQGNDRGRVFFKSGGATMLLCRATENSCKVIANNLSDLCEKLGTRLEGNLIWTR